MVYHPGNFKTLLNRYEKPADRLAELTIHEYNVIMYLVLDYITYLEYDPNLGTLGKGTFYYEDKIFAKISKLKINEYREGAKIIAAEFEEVAFSSKTVEDLAKYMIRYTNDYQNNKEERKKKSDVTDTLTMKSYKYKGLRYYDKIQDTIKMDDVQVLK